MGSPREVHLFDMNDCAVDWAHMLCELILSSGSPQSFISRVFARDVEAFEQRVGTLTHLNQEDFLSLPVSWRLRWSTEELLSAPARDVYANVLVPLQDGQRRFGWNTPRIVPCEDRRRLRNYTRTGLGAQGRLPGDGFASFLYGEGWLASQWTY